jgi:hypothetical protein
MMIDQVGSFENGQTLYVCSMEALHVYLVIEMTTTQI